MQIQTWKLRFCTDHYWDNHQPLGHWPDSSINYIVLAINSGISHQQKIDLGAHRHKGLCATVICVVSVTHVMITSSSKLLKLQSSNWVFTRNKTRCKSYHCKLLEIEINGSQLALQCFVRSICQARFSILPPTSITASSYQLTQCKVSSSLVPRWDHTFMG